MKNEEPLIALGRPLKRHPDDWKGNNIVSISDIKRLETISEFRNKKQKLSEKQRKYIYNYLNGYSKAQSLRRAGYSEMTIAHSTSAITKGERITSIIETFRDKLENKGVTKDKLAGKVSQFLDAKRKIRNKEGEVIDEEDDYQTQLKGFEIAKEFVLPDPKSKMTKKITLEAVWEDTK